MFLFLPYANLLDSSIRVNWCIITLFFAQSECFLEVKRCVSEYATITLDNVSWLEGSASAAGGIIGNEMLCPVENVESDALAQKIFRDGQIYIIRNGQIYSITGQSLGLSEKF